MTAVPPRAPSLLQRGVSGRVWPLVLLLICGGFIALTDARSIPVTVPLAVGVTVSAAFFWTLWVRRYPIVPWFEIGAVYLTVVTLYMAYPLVGYLALDHTYTPLNDSRLTMLQPSAEAVGRVGWLYVWHLVSFAAAYLVVRGRVRIVPSRLRRPRFSVFIAIVTVYLAIQAFVIFLGLFYNTQASTYAESYLIGRRLPLFLAQMLNHLGGIKYVLSLMLLAALFSRYPSSKRVIAGWILLVGIVTVARLGSRTELVLLVLSAAMMYHSTVRPLPLRWVTLAAAVGLSGFLVLGILRSGLALGGAGSAPNPFAYANEFENLFANAVHLEHVRDSIGPLPGAFYFADFAALIPQQLAPFEKIDRADWYVARFFPVYAAMGGGLAFGTIAESILTGGWISAALRGVLLGFLFAKLHRFCTRYQNRFWVFVFYVWVTTLTYQCMRNSTLILLVLTAYRFIPALVLVNVLASGISNATRVKGIRLGSPRPSDAGTAIGARR